MLKITGQTLFAEQLLAEELKKKGFVVEAKFRAPAYRIKVQQAQKTAVAKLLKDKATAKLFGYEPGDVEGANSEGSTSYTFGMPIWGKFKNDSAKKLQAAIQDAFSGDSPVTVTIIDEFQD